MLQQAKVSDQSQRVQIEVESRASGKQVKIRVEKHDEGLGWYTSGAVTLPLHQLPLLEQAIAEMRNCSAEVECADIIPFPGLDQASRGQTGA